MITASPGGDPTSATPPDIQRFREDVVLLRSILYIEAQLTSATSERYKKALE